jgi:flagellar biosynthesis protein FlhF
VEAFRTAVPAGAIITKLDETASLGELLSVMVKKHVPLTFVADGQRVPEDLHLARAADMVGRAADLSSADAFPEDSAMAEQYGEVRADAFN